MPQHSSIHSALFIAHLILILIQINYNKGTKLISMSFGFNMKSVLIDNLTTFSSFYIDPNH